MRGFIPEIVGGEAWAFHEESVRGAHVREKTCGGRRAFSRAYGAEPSEPSRGNAGDAAALPTGTP
jgi:hypothetical protein